MQKHMLDVISTWKVGPRDQAEVMTVVDKVMGVGSYLGMEFQEVGEGGMPDGPTVLEEWTINHADQDDSEIPDEGLKAMAYVKVAVPGVEFLIAHEPKKFDWERVIGTAVLVIIGLMLLPIIAYAVLTVVATVLAIAVLPLIIIGGMAALCGGSDPWLIAVLPDEKGTWIKLWEWEE